MTKRTLASNETILNSPSQHSTLSAERQQEQATMLEPFYEQLIGMTFNESTTAIERCRDLCAEFGFTVKQEASTHRNIYVYCSREGLPDSLRNPKSNPQRKRPSKRCDCRWRVVLFEDKQNQWEFRKSMNPEAGKHNHELMRPEDIERTWPKDVTALICESARSKLSTQEIRARVRGRFPNIHWNERRFYNRLSEERQKIKLRDSAGRTHELSELWSKVCMATAGNHDLSEFVKQEMKMLFQSICETVNIDSQTFPSPFILRDDVQQDHSTTTTSNVSSPTSSIHESQEAESSKKAASTLSNIETITSAVNHTNPHHAPKGYLTVEIPKQLYYIKIHNQRHMSDTPLIKNQRRTFSEDASSNSEPPKKLSRKGKNRQSPIHEQQPLATNEPIQHQQQQHHSHHHPHHPLNRLIPSQYTANRSASSSSTVTVSPTSRQLDMQHPNNTTFIYYENSNMPLGSSLYVNPSFQNSYNLPETPTTPGFTPPELTFSFDPSMRTVNESNNNNENSNEPTIHPALQSNPMSSQQQPQKSPAPPPPAHQQIRIIYESPNHQRSYQRQQEIFMRPTNNNENNATNSNSNNTNQNILPLYPPPQ